MENDNMWLDENGIQLLEQYELDEYEEKNYFTQSTNTITNLLTKSIVDNPKSNNKTNFGNLKDVFAELVTEDDGSDYNIGKLLDLRDSLQKKEQVQKNSFNKISQNFVYNNLNPLRNSKLPVVPASKSYEDYAVYNSAFDKVIKPVIKTIIDNESLTANKTKLLGTGNNNLEASVSSAMCWKYLNMQKHGIGDIKSIAGLIKLIIDECKPASGVDITIDLNKLDILKLFEPYNAKNKTETNVKAEYKLLLKGLTYVKKPNVLKNYNSNRTNHKIIGPYLFEIFQLTIMCLKKVKDRHINNIDDGIFSTKELEQLDSNITSSINSLDNLLRLVLFKYINVVTKKGKGQYGFSKAEDYKKLDEEHIRTTHYMNKYSFLNEHQIEKLLYMFQEDTTGKPIEMGGFCQEPYIFRLSLDVYETQLSGRKKVTDSGYRAISKLVELQENHIFIPSLRKVFNLLSDLSTNSNHTKLKALYKTLYHQRKFIINKALKLGKNTKYNQREVIELKYKYTRIHLTFSFIDKYIELYGLDDIGTELYKEIPENNEDPLEIHALDELLGLDTNTINTNYNTRSPKKDKLNTLLNDINKFTQELDRDINNNNSSNDSRPKKKRKKSSNSNSSNSSNSNSSNSNSSNSSDNINSKLLLKKYPRLMAIHKKIKGKTIYIPYIKETSIGKDSYGLFNILNVALHGKIGKGDIIDGGKINGSKGIKHMSSTGYILVGSNLGEMKRNAKWRAIDHKTIMKMKKLSSSHLRKKIDSILSDETAYNKGVKHSWGDESQTKTKLKEYCAYIKRKLKDSGKKSRCDMLLHTARIAKWIS